MRKRKALVNGHSMRDAVTGIKHNTSRTTGSVQGQDSLDGYIESWGIECFKHDLRHFLAIGFGVQRSLRQQNGVFFWSDSELVIECVMPDLLHVIPVGDNTVFDGVLKGQYATLGLGFVTLKSQKC